MEEGFSRSCQVEAEHSRKDPYSVNLIKEGKAMSDKTIRCRDCGQDFVFTEGEQAFYKEKGLENEPTRCPACRKARKQARFEHRNSYRR